MYFDASARPVWLKTIFNCFCFVLFIKMNSIEKKCQTLCRTHDSKSRVFEWTAAYQHWIVSTVGMISLAHCPFEKCDLKRQKHWQKKKRIKHFSLFRSVSFSRLFHNINAEIYEKLKKIFNIFFNHVNLQIINHAHDRFTNERCLNSS